AGLFDGVVRETEHGDHAAGSGSRGGHGGAPGADGRECIQGIERLGRHQAGKLAHAVARDQRGTILAGPHQSKQPDAVKADGRFGWWHCEHSTSWMRFIARWARRSPWRAWAYRVFGRAMSSPL